MKQKLVFLLPCALVLAAGCNFFADLASPFEVSKVRLRGKVVDSRNDSPLTGATVFMGDKTGETDESGIFEFDNVSTGRYSLTVEKESYMALSDSITVYLPGGGTVIDTSFGLQVISPRVIRFDAFAPAIDDSVRFVFEAEDSAGAISWIRLDFGDGQDTLFIPESSKMQGQIFHLYEDTGSYSAQLTIADNTSDTAAEIVQVKFWDNYKPTAILHFFPEEFRSGQTGRLMITVQDPDTNLNSFSLDWGDTSALDTGGFPIGRNVEWSFDRWHTYNPANDQYFDVTVALADVYGAQSIYVKRVFVRKIYPPLLAAALVFEPLSLSPTDTTVTVSCRVLQITDYVKQIVWEINPVNRGRPEYRYERDTLNASSGAIPMGGRIFQKTFDARNLLPTNYVIVRVYDPNSGVDYGKLDGILIKDGVTQ